MEEPCCLIFDRSRPRSAATTRGFDESATADRWFASTLRRVACGQSVGLVSSQPHRCSNRFVPLLRSTISPSTSNSGSFLQSRANIEAVTMATSRVLGTVYCCEYCFALLHDCVRRCCIVQMYRTHPCVSGRPPDSCGGCTPACHQSGRQTLPHQLIRLIDSPVVKHNISSWHLRSDSCRFHESTAKLPRTFAWQHAK